jgi:hypothetical protein
VWGLLRNSCDPTVSSEDSLAILQAAGVIAYSNSLTLCYDETGMPYRLPIAIINDPESYLPERPIDADVNSAIEEKQLEVRQS